MPCPNVRATGCWRAAALASLLLLPATMRRAAAQAAPLPAARDTSAPVTGTVRVTGTVYDSVRSRPLGGAVVQLVRAAELTAARSVTADSLGRFVIDSVTPGAHLVGFYHPLLDVLGVELV